MIKHRLSEHDTIPATKLSRQLSPPSPPPPSNHDLRFPTESITDATGLQRAYQQGDAYPFGDTLYIAGSHTAKDWYDDVTKIPFWGDVRQSTRYRQAEQALKANPNITKVVGHSLGGSVALELQRNYPNLKSRTYGAPVLDLTGSDAKAERFRNWLDPVSVFDRSAHRSVKWNPFNNFSLTHAYDNIAEGFKATGQNGWENPDGSYSLVQ